MPQFRVEPKVAGSKVLFGDPKHRGLESLWLGTVAELGAGRLRVSLDASTEHVIAVVGKRGSGKSFTLGVLVEALSAQTGSALSELVPTHATLLLDSLNIYWATSHAVPDEPAAGAEPLREQRELLRQWRLLPESVNVQLYAPAGFVPAHLAEEATPYCFTVGEFEGQDWADLFDVDLVRDPMGQAIQEAWQKVTKLGWKKRGGAAVPADPFCSLQSVLTCLENDADIQQHFARETVRAVQQRFRGLLGYSVFADLGTSLSELLKPGVTTILLLGDVPDDLRRVFVSVLARRLLVQRGAASGRAKKAAFGLDSKDSVEPVPPTWLMIDEAQNFLPAREHTAATESLIRFVREGRNSGLSFVVTTQQPNAIDTRILAQVDTLLAHQLVTAKDVQVVMDNLKSPLPRTIQYGNRSLKLAEALPMLDVGQALLTSPELPRAMFLAVRPRVTMHGGFEA